MVIARKPTDPDESSQGGSESRLSNLRELKRSGASNWRDQIAADPHRPGASRARLKQFDIPVWAVIRHLKSLDEEFSEAASKQTASDFELPVSAVSAAIEYYLEHQQAIDALLTLQADVVA